MLFMLKYTHHFGDVGNSINLETHKQLHKCHGYWKKKEQDPGEIHVPEIACYSRKSVSFGIRRTWILRLTLPLNCATLFTPLK